MLEVKWKVIIKMAILLAVDVSILVMLEVKWKDGRLVVVTIFCTVSILVMLEVKWKASRALMSAFRFGCFNPCYVGSKMESETSS